MLTMDSPKASSLFDSESTYLQEDSGYSADYYVVWRVKFSGESGCARSSKIPPLKQLRYDIRYSDVQEVCRYVLPILLLGTPSSEYLRKYQVLTSCGNSTPKNENIIHHTSMEPS